jgi:amino acid adenylation domain-containing protein
MTDVRRRIAALSPEQRALLERRLASTAGPGTGSADRVPPRDPDRPIPLSVAQQREWAISRFRAANNIPGAFRVEGKLDLTLLSRVLTEVLERHEVLRSTVELVDERTPVQVVHPATPVPTPVVDLSRLTPVQQRDEIRRRCRAELIRPFDPAETQRMRITLMRLAEETHVALLVTDHAASDYYSMAILVLDFVALYARHLEGTEGPPPPPIQFGDFAAWQRERLTEERIAAELSHWRQTLDGIPAGLALPTDRARPARPTFAGDAHATTVTPAFAAELRQFGERENVSLFMVLLAACAVLLYRYLEQDDLLIGAIASGRNRPETEPLIGCFVTPLPLRLRLSDELTLRDVVRQARDTMATAFDHQDLPLDRLIEELGLEREAMQTTLSPIWVNVLAVPDNALEIPGLRITPEPLELDRAAVDLSLSAIPGRDGLRLEWQYMTELFDPETVALLADQFLEIVRQVVATPDATVRQVRLADSAEPITGARPAATANAEPGFVELFQRRVAQAPNAPAVVCDGTATTFAELNRQANRLARHLRARGVGRETPVGILVDRSPLLATAILAVLKAGGVYVPVDSAYPPERMAFMLADAGARLVLTQHHLAGVLAGAASGSPAEALLLDGPPIGGGAGADLDLPDPPDPASLAYVVYTSGSTGQPKGAMVEHRSLVTFAQDVRDRLGLGAGDRFLQFASPSFDVLVEELFPTWLAGGAVVIPSEHLISGGGDLAELVERDRITVMELPTAYWHEWVRELDRTGRELASCLRLVIIGGERVLPDRLAMWRRLGVPLLHVYGLTETTVSSTFFRVDPVDQVEWANLPIGTALPSARLRVLDRRLRPVPLGGTGELYIGGVSVARGYLGRPGLTAQRFVADPDPAGAGQRLYRTGDLVRYRADGNLEFISRVDTQIKIRGFRVEPTEIESALGRHPQVAESVVALYEPAPGDRRLVAYVVPVPGASPAVGELRRFLERELPAYLVPSAFVELDALPLSTNGKVDRGRLPAPDGGRPELTDEYVAPQSPLQQQIADIVATVVGVANVGIHDNFFEIGGDSILAIQVVAGARDEGIRLSPYDLFAHPTVASLAEVATAGPTVDAEQGDVTGPVPLAPAQRWLCTAGVDEPHHWNISALLDLPAPAEPRLVHEAVDRLLSHHDGLRQRFLLAGDRTRVRIAPPGDIAPFDVYDLSDVDAGDRDRRLLELAERMQTGLDLAVGPLLRVALIRSGAGQPDRLAAVVHRLVADETSMRILLEDLPAVVGQLTRRERVKLPAKTTSWQAWVRRLTAYAATPAVQAERAYWTELATRPAAALPSDAIAERPDPGGASTRTVTAALSRAETGGLLNFAPEALNCQVEELLLTALGRTLSEWSGHARHVVHVERHGREPLFDDVDVTRTVGWFSYLYPVALTGEPDSSPVAALKATKEELRSVPGGGVGWSLLRQDPDPVPDAPAELAFAFTEVAAPEPFGANESPRARRRYAVEVRASVVAGELLVRWRYSEHRHERRTMERLARCHLDEVRALIDASRQTALRVHTPSDFPFARVDQTQLDDLLSRF